MSPRSDGNERMWDDATHTWVPMPAGMHDEAPEERAARWVLRLLATSIFVVVVAAVFVVTVTVSRDDQQRRPERAAGPSSVTTGPAAPSGIGPAPGSRVDDYIRSRSDELRALPPSDAAPRTAIVSLRAYSPESVSRKVTGEAKVLGFLLAVPGGGPTIVTKSLAAWSEEQRRVDIEERDAIAALIPTSGNDPSFQACYRKEVVRLDKAIAAASPTAPVVFGIAVQATPDELRRLAADPAVRLVDTGAVVPATGQAQGDATPQWRGLRPEEAITAGEPVLRPLDADDC